MEAYIIDTYLFVHSDMQYRSIFSICKQTYDNKTGRSNISDLVFLNHANV